MNAKLCIELLAKAIVVLTCLFVIVARAADTNTIENKLLGSWKVASVTWKSDNKSSTIELAQPGIFLFTPLSYSIMWTPTKEARTPFKILSSPTDEEAIAGFKSVVFNGGSYEFTEDRLTTTAFIAKVPGFEGGK